jgi:spore coat polysaccharide biosynthesis protein SpsF
MADSGLAGQVVVALPHGEEQDPIAEVCASMSIPVVRGHESDLLDRHLVAARAFGADVVVKVPSDCPLIDPAVMDLVIATHLANRTVSDFVSNLHPMSWPDGQDVEVVPIDVLEEAAAEARRPFEREHTTPFIWEQPARYRLANVAWHRDVWRSHRLTVDYAEDLELVEAVLAGLGGRAPVEEIVGFLEAHPHVDGLNARFRGVNWYRHHLDELTTVTAGDTRPAPGETTDREEMETVC